MQRRAAQPDKRAGRGNSCRCRPRPAWPGLPATQQRRHGLSLRLVLTVLRRGGGVPLPAGICEPLLFVRCRAGTAGGLGCGLHRRHLHRQLVHLWRERQSGLASEGASRELLVTTDDCLRLVLDVSFLGLHALAAAGRADAAPAALAQGAALSAQLRPAVLRWLRCTLDGVDWVVSTAGEGQRCLCSRRNLGCVCLHAGALQGKAGRR